jgi:hypothetical protein
MLVQPIACKGKTWLSNLEWCICVRKVARTSPAGAASRIFVLACCWWSFQLEEEALCELTMIVVNFLLGYLGGTLFSHRVSAPTAAQKDWVGAIQTTPFIFHVLVFHRVFVNMLMFNCFFLSFKLFPFCKVKLVHFSLMRRDWRIRL